jgi:hypothetical protein
MDGWILAHGSGVDDVLVLAVSSALVLAVRRLVVRRRAPEDEEPEEVSVPRRPGRAARRRSGHRR